MATIAKTTGKKIAVKVSRETIQGNLQTIDTQIAYNLPQGKYLTIYLKNGLRINGRFKVWRKYEDKSKFLDMSISCDHYLIYDNSIRDYRVIVKKNIDKIAANNLIIKL